MIVYTPKTVIFTHFLYFYIQNMDKTESVFPGPLPPLCEGQFFAWKFLLGYLTLCEKLVGGIFVEHEIHFREPIARPVHLTELFKYSNTSSFEMGGGKLSRLFKDVKMFAKIISVNV